MSKLCDWFGHRMSAASSPIIVGVDTAAMWGYRGYTQSFCLRDCGYISFRKVIPMTDSDIVRMQRTTHGLVG